MVGIAMPSVSTAVSGSRKPSSASGRRLVYFHASVRGPGSPAWRNAAAAASRGAGSPGNCDRKPS